MLKMFRFIASTDVGVLDGRDVGNVDLGSWRNLRSLMFRCWDCFVVGRCLSLGRG